MAKQLNVNLSVDADVTRAKRKLESLQQQINDLTKNPLNLNGLTGTTEEIKKASAAVAELQALLSTSKNIKTGALDLTSFNKSLIDSGHNLEYFRSNLASLGTEGQNAFYNLCEAIITADAPLKRANKLVENFKISLQNAARWQMSSTVLHGFIGTLQSAVGYSEKLNKSLSDIRVVTGQNTDQMAKFATQANKAAKELSTNTTAYTNAALIYYQQGLTDEEVAKRVKTTLQLSNVTGETTSDVASYMTAIWNNFDDGSKSLEHYGDVLTALGAATASSSKEIAGGLEQFSSIASTVGLSYEYSTSALATVVAATRQSEDTVGTAFRTLFGRLQGLSLGETLEDGTTLNKYSSALRAIGVNIKDANGELLSMDNILDQLGPKWETLSRDTQVALAQTIGGTRQYATLVSLLDNWEAFQKNLKIAQNSDGSLQKQANIYAESWEAAQKRVQAALQSIYQDLLDDKAFIAVTNAASTFLNTIDNIIDSLGGLKTILPLLGTVGLKLFGKDIREAGASAYSLLSGKDNQSQKDAEKLRQQAVDLIEGTSTGSWAGLTMSEGISHDYYAKQLRNQMMSRSIADMLTEDQKKNIQYRTELADTYKKKAVERANIIDQTSPENGGTAIYDRIADRYKITDNNRRTQVQNFVTQNSQQFENNAILTELIRKAEKGDFGSGPDLRKNAVNYIKDYFSTGEMELRSSEYGNLQEDLVELLNSKSGKSQGVIDLLKRALNASNELIDEQIAKIAPELTGSQTASVNQKAATILKGELSQRANSTIQVYNNNKRAQETLDGISDFVRNIQQQGPTTAQALMDMAQNIGLVTASATGFTNSITSLITAFSSGDISGIIASGISAAASGGTFLRNSRWFKSNDAPLTRGQENTRVALNSLIYKHSDQYKFFNNLRNDSSDWTSKDKGKIEQFKNFQKNLGLDLVSDKDLTLNLDGGSSRGYKDIGNKIKNALNNEENQKKITDRIKDKTGISIGDFSKYIKGFSGISIGIQAVIAGYQLWGARLQKNAKQAERNLQVVNEQNQKNQELVQSIKDLGSQYEDGTISLKQLREEAYNLCLQYNEEDLAVKALTASYDQLQQMLNGFSQESAGKVIKSTNATIKAYEKIAGWEKLNFIKQGWNALTRGTDKIALSSGDNTRTVQQTLKKAGYSGTGEFSYDDFKELYTSGQDDLVASLANQNDTIAKWYGQLLTDETATKLHDLSTQLLQTTAQYWQSDATTANIDSLKDYDEQLKKIAQDLVDKGLFGSVEAAMSQAQTILKNANSNISRFDKITRLSEALNINAELLDEYNDNIINFLLAHKDLLKDFDITTKDKIDQYLSDNAKTVSANEGVQNAVNANNIITQGLTSGKYNTEDVYNQITDLDSFTGKNSDEFAGATFEEQTRFLLQYYQTRKRESKEAIEIAKQEAERNRNAFVKTDEYQTALSDFDSYIDSLDSKLEKAGITAEEYKELLAKAMGGEELTEAEQKTLNSIDSGYASKDSVKNYTKAANKLKDLNAVIKELTITEENAKAVHAIAMQAFENSSDMLDSVQEAYSTLCDAVSEYNQNGYLTIDTAQKLMALDTEYLAALQYQNGQLTVNTNSFQYLAQAQLRTMLMSKMERIQTEIASMSKEELAKKNLQVAYTADLASDSLWEMAKAAQAGDTALFTSLLSANGYLDGLDGLDNLKQYYANAYKSLFDVYNLTSKGIDTNFNSAMNVASQTAKKLDDEIDRYHEIKELIEDVESALNDLSTAKDRAFGTRKLDLIDQEIDKYKEELSLQEEYLRQIKENYAHDQAVMRGYGRTFDELGNISNYEELVTGQINAYNGALDDAASEAYDNFKNALSLYEESNDLYRDQLSKIIEIKNQIFDSQLEKIEYAVTIKIDLDSRKFDLLSDFLDKISDKAHTSAEQIANLTEQIDNLQSQNDVNKAGILNILGLGGVENPEQVFEELKAGVADVDQLAQQLYDNGVTEDGINQLKEYADAIYDNSNTIYESLQKLYQALGTEFQNWIDDFDNVGERLEHITKMTQTYKDLIALTGRKSLGLDQQVRKSLDNALVKQTQNQTTAIKNELDAAQKSYDNIAAKAKDALEKYGADSEEYYQYEQILKEQESTIRSIQENLADRLKESIEQVKETFSNALDDMVENFNSSLGGIFGNLEALKNAYDHQKELNDAYLKTYEKEYELNKLNRQIQNSIDDTDNIKAKQSLVELQQQLVRLQQSGADISSYDLEVLQKTYELRLAQIALEEAQNAKSQVNLVRNNDGTYGYVYTADQDKIDDAIQNYEDKLFALQDLNTKYIDEMSEKIIQTQQQYIESRRKILEDASLSDEERQAQLEELGAWYEGMIEYYTSQMQNAIDNNMELNGDLVDSFDKTTLAIISDYESIDDIRERSKQAMLDGIEEEKSALEDYKNNIQNAYEAAGSAVEDFANNVNNYLNQAGNDSDNLANKTMDMKNSMISSMNDVIRQVGGFESSWNKTIGNMMNQNSKMVKSIYSVINATIKLKNVQNNTEGGYVSAGSIGSGSGGGSGINGSGGNYSGSSAGTNTGNTSNQKKFSDWYLGSTLVASNIPQKGSAIEVAKRKYDYPYDELYKYITETPNGTVYAYRDNKGTPHLISGAERAEWIKKYGASQGMSWPHNGAIIEQYDTGGYTGQWGPEGKAAILHEKELVLNKDDTANMLSMVQIARKVIESGARLAQTGLSLDYIRAKDTSSDINQNITINASFPEATNHNEIEEAFHNLLNTATQYVNRK